MKTIRATFASAALAGLVLVTAFAAAPAKDAAELPQAAGKPCGTITVAAASDLTYAMNEIAANFEKATGCTVRLSMGSSGNFLTQIENGAPFDVFFSADIAYPKKLEAEGRAAEEALRQAGVYDAVKDRLVLGENISQAAEFVESGNADAGILALSLVASPAMKDKGRAWNIPENLYTPIQQGAVVVRAAGNPEGARQFLDFIRMPATAALLERYGFALPARTPDGGKH